MIFYKTSPTPQKSLKPIPINKGSIIIIIVIIIIKIYHIRNWILEIMTHKLCSFSSFNMTVHE